MADTDSEIKGLWDRCMERWEEYERTKQLPPGAVDAESFTRDTRNELASLNVRWREILARRKRGELTDTTNTDAVTKVARDLAKLHGFDVKIAPVDIFDGRVFDHFGFHLVVFVALHAVIVI